jgi:hypothetical protein
MRLAVGTTMPRLLITVLVVSVAACGGGSPTEPSNSTSSPTTVQGQTISAIDGTPLPSLSVKVGGRFPITADGSGFFRVDVGNQSTQTTVIDGNAVVSRETRMAASESPTRVSMIPASFDLRAFDEMFRTSNAQLQRWTARPALVILASVMDYRNNSDQNFSATGEQLTDAEIEQLKAHLTEGLALLTGNTYTTFASIEIERPSGGSRVNTLRAGQIVVGRYNGIQNLVKTIGYGMWSEQPNGSIGGGSMYLDRNFDHDDNRRRLLRIHELGHALGYQHVESRTSIMNPSVGPEPTEFDRMGALIAFARPVGNKSPDIDPASMVLSASSGGGRWVGPTTQCSIAGQ